MSLRNVDIFYVDPEWRRARTMGHSPVLPEGRPQVSRLRPFSKIHMAIHVLYRSRGKQTAQNLSVIQATDSMCIGNIAGISG